MTAERLGSIDHLSQLGSEFDTDTFSLAGVLGRDEFSALSGAVERVLATPLDDLASGNRAAFAFPSEPLLYATTAEDFLEWQGKATMVVQMLENLDVYFRDLEESLGEKTGKRVSVSMYIAKPGSSAFDWHTDKWRSIIVQVFGSKEFHFRELSDTSVLLTPGSVLLIEKDHPHRTSVVTSSAHVAITIHDAPR